MKFGENLKKIRKDKKISQEDLALKINVSRQMISRWENSEDYPSMNEMIELCKVFRCKMNYLVDTDMKDISSLDKDIVDNVNIYNEEKYKNVKALSHVIGLIGKIGKIVLMVALPFVIIAMLLVAYVVNNVDVIDEDIILKTSQIEFISDNEIELFNFISIGLDDFDSSELIKIINDNSKCKIIFFLESCLLVILVELVLMIFVLKHVESLFDNIKEKDTPFILDNVNYIKWISYLIAILILVNSIPNMLIGNIVGFNNVGNLFEFVGILEILIIFCMSYIFEYGYEIQKDSKNKMYK